MKKTSNTVSKGISFRILFFLLLFLSVNSKLLYGQSPDCAGANQMCPDQGATTYNASTNAGSAEPGNNYGCLATTPNPAWFFVQVANPGSAVVFLSNSNNVDIDFAMWGPFSSLNDALGNCGSLGPPTSCSYSPAPNEIIVFPASSPGQVYLIMITNFSNMPTNISAVDPAGPNTIFGCSPPCRADGGLLVYDDVEACFGDPSLNLQLFPTYGASAPPASDYGYTHLICTPGGTVLSTNMGPNMTSTAPGTYMVCGLSYELADAAFVPTAIGQNVNNLRSSLNGPSPLFCGDVSDNCIQVTIGPPIPPTFLPVEQLCPGDCITGPDGNPVCNPGSFQYTFTTNAGCDSVVNLTVVPIPPSAGTITLPICEGGCITVNGRQVCAPGPVVQSLTAKNGCDSILTIRLTIIPVDAEINPTPPPTLSCSTTSVSLNGDSSTMGAALTWVNQSGQNIGSGRNLSVNQPGSISLIATVTQGQQICRDTDMVVILGNALGPDISTSDQPVICRGTSFDLTTLTIVDANNTNGTLTYHSGTPANPGNQINPVVNPNTTTTYYILSTSGSCTDETSVTLTVSPQPDISVANPPTICSGDTVFFNTLTIDDANNANGNITFHTGTPATPGNQINSSFWTGSSTTTIYVLSSVGTCSDETSFSVTVNPVPTSDFSVSDAACQGDTLVVTYTGNALPSATFNWNFNGGMASPGSGIGPHNVFWTTSGPKNVTLRVTQNGCTSAQSANPVTVSAPLTPPIINCQEFLDSILFTWMNVPGANGYQTNVISGQTGTDLGNNTFGFYNLTQGEQVTFEVIAESGTPCPNTISTLTCTAQNCPTFTVTIDPVNSICLDQNAVPFNLNANVTGITGAGTLTWTGTGIIDATNGTFDPVLAGPGNHVITARYEEGNCGENGNITITVLEQPSAEFTIPDTICIASDALITYTGAASANANYIWDFDGGNAVPGTGQGPHTVTWTSAGPKTITLMVEENNCSSTIIDKIIQVDATLEAIQLDCQPALDNIVFNWNTISNSTGYDIFINGTNNGNQANTSYQVNGLQPGDNVGIRVVAQSNNACPDVQASLTCTATDCPNLVIDFPNQPVICLDANAVPITLMANINGGNGTGNFAWSGTGITDTLNGIFDPNVSGPGQFFINATYTEGNCSETEVLTVTVNPQPTADFTSQSPVCVGDLSLSEFIGNAGVNATFQWSFDGGSADPGTGRDPQLVSWSTTGNKTVELVVTENGCASEPYSQTIQVDPPLTLPNITCQVSNSGIDFDWQDVTNALEYEVTVDNVLIGNQSNSDYSINGLNPGVSVMIEVTALSSNSCPSVTANRTCVTEDCPPITAEISSLNNAICEGDTTYLLLTLNAATSGPFDMVWSADGVMDTLRGVSNGFTWIVNPATSTNYQIHQIINQNFPSCDYPQNSQIIIDVRQPLNAGMPGFPLEVCATTDTFIQLADLLTGADQGGIWSETSSVPTIGGGFNPANGTFDTEIQVPGTYYFQYTVINAPCPSDDATVTVKLSQPAMPGLSKDTLMICQNVTELVDLFDLVEGETPNGVWQETGNNPSGGNQFDPSAGTFTSDNLTPGAYQFTYTVAGESPCPAGSTSVTIEILDLPSVNAGLESPYYLDCNEDLINLGDNNNPSGTNFIYQWTDENGAILGKEMMQDVNGAGVYQLQITDTLTGCINSDTTTVVERVTNPNPEISVAPVSCFGDNDGIIQVDTVTGGMGPYLFSLNGQPLSTNDFFNNLPPAQYTLTVEDAYGCKSEITLNIEQPENLLVDLVVYVDADGTIVLGDSVELNAFVNLDPNEIDSVGWSPPELFNNCDTCLRQVITPVENTMFSVTVISNDGCMASDDYSLRIRKERPVYIPSGFSPNNDGINDFFLIYPSPSVTKVKSFLVFDRWGEVIHEYYDFDPTDPAHGWDGKFRGEPLNTNVFTYFAEIEFVDGGVELFKGDVTLTR
jgi:gliding motility-associated-like protein